jgi:peptide/nickel transport system substrate-binding protein
MRILYGILVAAALAPAAAIEPLRIGIIDFPATRGNAHQALGPPYFLLWPAFFDGLTEIGPDGRARPALAVSWEARDPNTWVFRLRPNVVFSNGEALDAAAVVETITYMGRPESARFSVYNAYRGVSAARAIDDLTVEIATDRPDRLLPNRIGAIRIYPRRYWREIGPEGFARAPVGTGPFTVEKWSDTRITSRANVRSWRRPRLDALEFHAISEAPQRLQALQAGSIDISFGLTPDDRDAMAAIGGTLRPRPRGNVEVISFLTLRPSPLQDRRVRQALNYAVDRERIVKTLLGGTTVAATGPAARGVFGRDDSLVPYPYDLGKARELMRSAGFANGFDLPTEVVVGGSIGSAVFQQVASDLAAIRVNMILTPVPQAKILRGAYEGAWDGLAFSMNYGSLPYMDALAALRLHSCLWQTPWNCVPELARRVEEAGAAFDLGERERLTQALVRDVRDDAPAIWLFEEAPLDGIAARVRNYRAAYSFVNYEELELGE